MLEDSRLPTAEARWLVIRTQYGVAARAVYSQLWPGYVCGIGVMGSGHLLDGKLPAAGVGVNGSIGEDRPIAGRIAV